MTIGVAVSEAFDVVAGGSCHAINIALRCPLSGRRNLDSRFSNSLFSHRFPPLLPRASLPNFIADRIARTTQHPMGPSPAIGDLASSLILDYRMATRVRDLQGRAALVTRSAKERAHGWPIWVPIPQLRCAARPWRGVRRTSEPRRHRVEPRWPGEWRRDSGAHSARYGVRGSQHQA